MSDVDIVVGVRGDISGGRLIKRSLEDITKSGGQAVSATDKLKNSITDLNKSANLLKSTFAGLGVYFGGAAILRMADQYQTLNARIKEATRLTGDYNRVQREIVALSVRTGSALEDNVTLFQRLANSRNDLGATNAQMIRLAETVNKLGAVGGASVEGMRLGTMQLSQALSGGIVRAEEFNSIVENMSPVAQAAAKGMGLSFGELRQKMLDGEVTSRKFFEAILKGSSDADAAFTRLPVQLERAKQSFSTALQTYIGEVDAAYKATNSLASVVMSLAENIDMLAKAGATLVGAYLASFIARTLASTTALFANRIAANENAKATLAVALANREGAAAAFSMALAQGKLTGSYISSRAAGLELAKTQAAVKTAQATVTATTLGLSGALNVLKVAGAGVLAFFGGWVGLVLSVVSAIVIFRTEIMETLDKITIFGKSAGDILRDVAEGAKTIFIGIAGIVGGTFSGLLQMVKVNLAELEIILFKYTDKLSRTSFGQKLGITPYDIGSDVLETVRLSKMGLTDAYNEGFDSFNAKLADKIAERTGVGTPIPNGSGGTTSPGTDLNTAAKMQDKWKDLIAETRTEQEKLYMRIAELEAMRPFAKTVEQMDAVNRGIKSANDELEKLRVQAELNGPVGKAFQSLASEIDDSFKDSFTSVFTESDGGFKKLLSGWKASFKNFLADLAYQAAVRPIMVSLVGAVGGSMGLSSSAIADVLGTGTGTGSGLGLGSLSNVGSLFTGAKDFVTGGFSKLFGTSTSLVNGVNSVGDFLGIDKLSSMTSFTNGSFGGTLGASVGGIGGNLLANALLGDRGIGSTVGGTIGAIAGSFIPVPILGPMIGSFLGNAIGGLFGGGGLQRESLSAGMSVDQNGQLQVIHTGSKNGSAEQANAFGTQIATAINTITGIMGARFGGSFQADTNIGKKDTGTWYGGTKISGVAGDVESLVKHVLSLQHTIVGASSQMMDTLRKSMSMGSTVTQIASDLALAKSIFDTENPISSAVKDSIEAINKQFEEMTSRAEQLGLPMDKVTEALTKQRDAAVGAINALQAGFDSLQSMTEAFKSFLDGQALGSNSSLSPMDKLQLAQGNYDKLLGTAQGGDLSVTPQLLQAADTLLSVGRSVYASSVSFAGLEAFVRSGITNIARAAGVPGYANGTDNAAPGMAWVGERGPELVRFRGGEQVFTNAQSRDMARSGAKDNATMIALLSEIAENGRNHDERLKRLEAGQRAANGLAKVKSK